MISLLLSSACARLVCCLFYCIYFQAFIITDSFLIRTVTSYNVSSYYSIMPVITRSKAKASIGSSTELLIPPISVTSLTADCLQHNSDTIIASSFPDSPTLLSQDDPLLLDETSSMDISNLKISKFETLTSTSVTSMGCLPAHSFHNFLNIEFFKMKEEGDDSSSSLPMTSDMVEFSKLLASFSVQMSSHMDRLQDQLEANEHKMNQVHEAFKQEIREEIEQLKLGLNNSSSSPPSHVQSTAGITDTAPSIAVSPSATVIPSTGATGTTSTPSINPNTSTSSGDVQAQMMLMLTESFSKLSTVLADKTQDSKSEVKSD